MTRNRVVQLATATAVGVMLVQAAAASASSIQVVNGSAVLTAAPGEANDVRAGTRAAPDARSLKVIDNGASLTAGPGCQQIDAHSAWCPDPPSSGVSDPLLPLVVNAGDRNDQVDVDDNGLRDVTVYGEDGRDTIHVGSGAGSSPVLDGGRGDDDLSTANNGDGTPVLRGGPGNDELNIGELAGGLAYGGTGNDRILYTVGFNPSSPVRLDGGDGNDSYAFGPDFRPAAMVPGAGLDTLDQSLVSSSSGFTFDMSDCPGCVERVIGSPNDDQITGDGRAQAIFGGDGNDTLDGGGGSDVISGQAGDDTIGARDGAVDGVLCGAGADSVTADRFDLVDRGCELVSRSRVRA
jgi:Ca2+-binding RTX toxin-like protein